MATDGGQDRRAGAALHNFLWLGSERVVQFALALGIGTWLARYLGPESYGQLSLAGAIVSIAAGLATLGLDPILVRELVRRPDATGVLLGSALTVRLGATALAFAGCLAVALMLPAKDTTPLLVAVSALALLPQPWTVIDAAFQATENNRQPVIARFVASLGAAAGRIAAILAGAGLLIFALLAVLEPVLAALGMSRRLNRDPRLSALHWRSDRQTCRLLLAAGWPLLLSGLLVTINMQMGRLLLSAYSDDTQTGLYAAASRLTECLYVIPVIIGTVMMPRLIAAADASADEYRRTLQEVYNFCSLLLLPLCLLTSAGASELTGLLFGPAYSEAGPVLAVHVWTAMLVAHVSIRSRHYAVRHAQRRIALLAAGGCCAEWLLGVWLVPRAGALGAALAAVSAWSACTLALPLLLRDVDAPTMFLRSLWPHGRWQAIVRMLHIHARSFGNTIRRR